MFEANIQYLVMQSNQVHLRVQVLHVSTIIRFLLFPFSATLHVDTLHV